MTNVEALEITLGAMAFGPEHEALAQHCRTLASAVDDHPENASLAREYQGGLGALLKLAPETNENDGHAQLLELLRPAVGNAKGTRKAKPGSPNRPARKGARAGTDAVAATGRGRNRRASS